MKKNGRKRLRVNRLLMVILALYLMFYLFKGFFTSSIKNIYIYPDKIFKDQKIIELAGISNYPSCFLTTNASIRRRLLANPYIKEVKVDKDWFCKLNIKVDEYKILFQKKIDDKVVLENGEELLSDYQINDIPLLINYVPSEQYFKLIDEMKKIDEDILYRVSEIEYNPNEVDKERFLLSMNDGNYVYLTLYKYDQLNYYLKVLPELEGKKGIFYWDSGNYFKIIE